MPTINCEANAKTLSAFAFISILFSSVALPISPAMADAELDALQARLEKAQKENLKLKTEKLEKENLAMKAEGLEQENARLRAEAGKPVASSVEPVRARKPQSNVARHLVSYGAGEARYEKVRANRAINEAINNIPRNDPRRDLTASAQMVPVSTVSPVVQQWGGLYVGINAGYGTGEVNFWSNGPTFAGANTQYTTTSGSSIYNGPVVGGQIGYNYEFPNKVILGVEADMDYADINDKVGNGPLNLRTTTVGTTGISSVNQYGRSGIDWIGTARVRLGYDLGNFMPYFTGGLAYGGVSNNGLVNNVFTQDTPFGGFGVFSNQNGSATAAGNSSIQVGWAAGVGAELRVADHWSIRGEYLYTSLGSLSAGSGSASFTGFSCAACIPPQSTLVSGAGATQGSIGPFGIHQARVGLNYQTGWLTPSPVVAAKY